MVAINRIRLEWAGSGVVGGGVSTFYRTGDGAGNVAGMVNFANRLKDLCPAGALQWVIRNTGDVLDSATGDTTGTWTDSTFSTVNANGDPTYSQGVGGRISWRTLGRTNNRPVRGTTFIVPMCVNVWDTDGTLSSAKYTALQAAAQGLLTEWGPSFVIYTRPNDERIGGVNSVVSAQALDGSSWLRTRKH